jgi:hypothetical protein
MNAIHLCAAVLPLGLMGSVAVAAECGPDSQALMPSASELAALCPAELLFKKAPTLMGSKTMCHYDFGAPGAAGMMVSKESDKSAKAAADDAGKMSIPGYTVSTTKLPWSGVEGYAYSMSKNGTALSSAYFVDSKAGVLKIEFWITDRSKLNACLEKAVRAVLAKAK